MANELTLLRAGIAARGDKLVARGVERLERESSLELARIEHEAIVQNGRIRAVGDVASAGMREIALVSALEAQLISLTPHAAERIQFVADRAAIDMAEVVSETVRRVR